jgi:hypothetical protein
MASTLELVDFEEPTLAYAPDPAVLAAMIPAPAQETPVVQQVAPVDQPLPQVPTAVFAPQQLQLDIIPQRPTITEPAPEITPIAVTQIAPPAAPPVIQEVAPSPSTFVEPLTKLDLTPIKGAEIDDADIEPVEPASDWRWQGNKILLPLDRPLPKVEGATPSAAAPVTPVQEIQQTVETFVPEEPPVAPTPVRSDSEITNPLGEVAAAPVAPPALQLTPTPQLLQLPIVPVSVMEPEPEPIPTPVSEEPFKLQLAPTPQSQQAIPAPQPVQLAAQEPEPEQIPAVAQSYYAAAMQPQPTLAPRIEPKPQIQPTTQPLPPSASSTSKAVTAPIPITPQPLSAPALVEAQQTTPVIPVGPITPLIPVAPVIPVAPAAPASQVAPPVPTGALVKDEALDIDDTEDEEYDDEEYEEGAPYGGPKFIFILLIVLVFEMFFVLLLVNLGAIDPVAIGDFWSNLFSGSD